MTQTGPDLRPARCPRVAQLAEWAGAEKRSFYEALSSPPALLRLGHEAELRRAGDRRPGQRCGEHCRGSAPGGSDPFRRGPSFRMPPVPQLPVGSRHLHVWGLGALFWMPQQPILPLGRPAPSRRCAGGHLSCGEGHASTGAR